MRVCAAEIDVEKHRNIFQRAFDAIIEGRARKAQRLIEDYQRDRDSSRPRQG